MFPNFSGGMSFGLSVPYQTQIVPPLSNGTQIHISGTATGERFEVNLKNYQDDIVLHVNPRFDSNALVLNSAQRGSWANEERHALPIYRGARFTMVIMATDRSFKIAVNNSHVCEFHQRAPMHLAQLVEVKGDINLESVQVYGGSMSMGTFPSTSMGTFPSTSMGTFPSTSMGTYPSISIGGNMGFGPTTQPPFGGDFNMGFGFPTAPPSVIPTPFPSAGGVPSIQSCRITTGSRIFVRGFIPHGANRFELNFLQGYSDTDDVAFHFNPRFDSRTIVKNHRRNGQWGQEENQPFPAYMPLMPGSPIDLQVTCNMDRYTVYMNNQLIAEFSHKIPPGFVMAVQYKGDLQVSGIGQM